ncbi:protein star [Bombyx mori]|uniref:Star n=1 Tax=Bombyx mori TaxID=7091 RepID=Q8WR50_BOMMO|nr:protein star [Bombyx mori]AAL51081.1 Star [Bombyx mori]
MQGIENKVIMAEKTDQDNPPPPVEEPGQAMDKPPEPKPNLIDKLVIIFAETKTHSPRFTLPAFMKAPPNELYRRLLPAMLFVLTFVTVMTMLLIYMDTVALGAQQFRLNMTRDYELARIGQGSAALIAYVRQLHLTARSKPQDVVTTPTEQVKVLDSIFGEELYNGTFVEWMASGGRWQSTSYLESARGWSGLVARAAPQDYFALRAARTLHACLSPNQHPREISYEEEGFWTRVLCLPLYTVLAAAELSACRYVVLDAPPALRVLPFRSLQLQVLEVIQSDPEIRNQTTDFLLSKNYTVAATFKDSIMYSLKTN